MPPTFSFFNFSLNKVLAGEQDTFARAKIKIAFLMLTFAIVKIVITIPLAITHHQYIQATRSGAIFLIFFTLLKYLLYKPQHIRIIAHVVLMTGLFVIWSNLVFIIQQLNIVTVQVVVTTVLCSFYLIGNRTALIYSALSMLPVFLFMVITQGSTAGVAIPLQQVVSPVYEITVFLNFISIGAIHYLFYKAYQDNVIEKDLLNKQLAVKVAEVKALADAKSMFLASMSHELRTPLNAVIGITDLLKGSASSEQHENLEILEFSTVSLLSLVNDILDYHKSENDKIELEAIPVNLPELLNKIFSTLKLKANEKNLQLVINADKNLNTICVVSDPTRLTQIIYNLVGNAIKFTKKGKVELRVKLIETTEHGIQVQFIVKDTGIGIPETKHESIFEPFKQASTDTTRHFGGTGLGLAIVKKLLLLFNSSIEVESELGKGSRFSFNINFCVTEPQVSKPKTKEGMSKITHLSVLIAEDNSINAMLLERMLGNWGVKTYWAPNGQEVINKLNAEAVDLILMDLQMPVMDGYQTALTVRSLDDPKKSNTPIIALTASISSDIYPQVIAAGMQDYLSKPYEAVALYEKLEKIAAAVNTAYKPVIITIDKEEPPEFLQGALC
jgi:signal transduction histidine kinase/ActR/RegA family two-component response regulator